MGNGSVLLVIAMTLTPGVDALAKVLGATHTPFQVTFLRFLAAGIVALCTARILKIPVLVPKKGRIGQVIRTGLLVGATTCLVYALTLVPLAYAVGGFLIAPIVSTLCSVIFLRERLYAERGLGALLALIGAVIICDPVVDLRIGTVFALIGGAVLGMYLAATRGARDAGHPLASLAAQCLLGAALVAPFAFAGGAPALRGVDWALVAALGCLAATTHVLTVAAFERADASALAPYLYFNLVAAIVIGVVFFGEIPTFGAVIGLLGISIGGILSALPPSRLSKGILSGNRRIRAVLLKLP